MLNLGGGYANFHFTDLPTLHCAFSDKNEVGKIRSRGLGTLGVCRGDICDDVRPAYAEGGRNCISFRGGVVVGRYLRGFNEESGGEQL